MWTGQQPVGTAFAEIAAWRQALRRYRVPLALWLLAATALGALDIARTPAEYIASTQFVLKPRLIARDGPDAVRQYHQFRLDGLQVETELQMIRSERLLRSVFDSFDRAGPHVSGESADPVIDARWGAQGTRAEAFEAFRARTTSRRLGLSYVIEIGFRAPDPTLAARVANAITAAYVQDRMVSAIASERAGTPYLRSRVTAMLTEQVTAEAAVRQGTLPTVDLPDAGVQLLGPAREPLARTAPRTAPTLMLSVGAGLISGLLVLAVLPRPRASRATGGPRSTAAGGWHAWMTRRSAGRSARGMVTEG